MWSSGWHVLIPEERPPLVHPSFVPPRQVKIGDAATFVQGDVKDKAACENAIEATVERYGHIDILVPNAGGSADQAPVVDMTDEAMQDALLWNFWHAFWTMRTPMIRASRSGCPG